MVEGLVIRNTGSQFVVLTEDGREIDCRIKGNLRIKGIRSTNPVACGDHVMVEERSDTDEPVSYIRSIVPRRNYIIRKASNLSKESHILGANLDAALLLCTISNPETSTTFIDRFLATACAYRVPVILVFNKVDIYSEDEQAWLDYLVDLYTKVGYPCLAISAELSQGLDRLKELLKGKITLLSGHSGVGKSTLINRLIPSANRKTAAISDMHHTGVHTTTFSEMIKLPHGGYLIDTPGIKGFGTLEMNEEDTSHYFPEIFEKSKECRFSNCTHTHEPGCAVIEAVESEEIAPTRYNSYLSILSDSTSGKYRPEY